MYNPNLHLVNISAYIKFRKNLSICSQDIERKRKFCVFKGHDSGTNMRKKARNNPKLYLVNINAYMKFGENLSIFSQDIEQKRSYDGQTDE